MPLMCNTCRTLQSINQSVNVFVAPTRHQHDSTRHFGAELVSPIVEHTDICQVNKYMQILKCYLNTLIKTMPSILHSETGSEKKYLATHTKIICSVPFVTILFCNLLECPVVS